MESPATVSELNSVPRLEMPDPAYFNFHAKSFRLPFGRVCWDQSPLLLISLLRQILIINQPTKPAIINNSLLILQSHNSFTNAIMLIKKLIV